VVRFNPSPEPTVGVEWELQLLDPTTCDLIDGIMPLMEFFPSAEFVKPEYIQSCVELNSKICADSAEVARDLSVTLSRALRRCTELEMRLCGGGTHPFCRRLALITPLPRYKHIAATAGLLSHMQITFSTHVHVGLPSGDDAMRVMSRLIPAVPVFVAMSANSPFWRGHETGHVAYRHRILAAAPNYGLPTRYGSWAEFDAFLTAAKRCGMISSFKDIHWDIRPHPDFGTLELRAMDSVSTLENLRALTAFARALMLALADAGDDDVAEVLPAGLPLWAELENRYRASRVGLDAEYIVDAAGGKRPIRELAAELIDFSIGTAGGYGETEGLSMARTLLDKGSDHLEQLEAYRKTNLVRSVVEALSERLIDGS
jgi:carboxylate-amine ligase